MSRRQWRALVKKLRRKKIRQQIAKERDDQLAQEEAAKLLDPEYQKWLQNQESLEQYQREVEERLADEGQEQWLRGELLAQKHFREAQEILKATEAEKEAECQRIENEYKERQEKARQRQLERQRKREEAAAEFDRLMEKMYEYLNSNENEIPAELKLPAESNPGRECCPFFGRTSCCRFGQECNRNHVRPMIGRILVVRNFFSHIRLEQSHNTEYGSDISLEYTDAELQQDYDAFFNDVVSELEKYGALENFRTTCNCQPYLRGHVFVEYKTPRDALKAFIKLQGRYYASKQLNVEFSAIPSWRSAICGLSFARKCPKGRNCNFLHIFRNPGNKYNKNVFENASSARRVEITPGKRLNNTPLGWNDVEDSKQISEISKRNWRWSESPEHKMQSPAIGANREISCKLPSVTTSPSDIHRKRKSSRTRETNHRSGSESSRENRRRSEKCRRSPSSTRSNRRGRSPERKSRKRQRSTSRNVAKNRSQSKEMLSRRRQRSTNRSLSKNRSRSKKRITRTRQRSNSRTISKNRSQSKERISRTRQISTSRKVFKNRSQSKERSMHKSEKRTRSRSKTMHFSSLREESDKKHGRRTTKDISHKDDNRSQREYTSSRLRKAKRSPERTELTKGRSEEKSTKSDKESDSHPSESPTCNASLIATSSDV